jgi:mannose-6-phosphate isomerase-like protein (cupin superfamily)
MLTKRLNINVADTLYKKTQDEDPGFDVRNIEEETIANDNFRKVIVTGNNLQLVLMSLPPGGEIGMETHKDVDQFFRIEEGEGTLDTKASGTYPLKAGSSVLIKAGTAHNIIAGDKGIKLYTLYAPPNHAIDIVQKTKEEADAAEQAGTDVPPEGNI